MTRFIEGVTSANNITTPQPREETKPRWRKSQWIFFFSSFISRRSMTTQAIRATAWNVITENSSFSAQPMPKSVTGTARTEVTSCHWKKSRQSNACVLRSIRDLSQYQESNEHRLEDAVLYHQLGYIFSIDGGRGLTKTDSSSLIPPPFSMVHGSWLFVVSTKQPSTYWPVRAKTVAG